MNSDTPTVEPVTVSSAEELANAAFRWLLVLGFPPSVAAASVMPQIFRSDDEAAHKQAA